MKSTKCKKKKNNKTYKQKHRFYTKKIVPIKLMIKSLSMVRQDPITFGAFDQFKKSVDEVTKLKAQWKVCLQTFSELRKGDGNSGHELLFSMKIHYL